MASGTGTVYEPYIFDLGEILCCCSPSNSEQIDICFTKIGLVLLKISHFEISTFWGCFVISQA